ncbi:hypothetical protein IHE45_18G071800 [Dioscorea alata]|uniref:Uncharacterized protein n=1 Tax=Dioscorea alata TaxID=55571 RepID=A0ACB7U7V8_DIOAL|nr:hypothetical protein IHE45_18G071800 [Dioscorea alata]
MDRNLKGLLIGSIGALLTLFAYSQTIVSTTQSITIGFLLLSLGLLIKEGLLPF